MVTPPVPLGTGVTPPAISVTDVAFALVRPTMLPSSDMLPLAVLLASRLTVLLDNVGEPLLPATVMLGMPPVPAAVSVKMNVIPCDGLVCEGATSLTADESVIFTTPAAIACSVPALVDIGNPGPMLPPPGVVAVVNVRLGVTIVTAWSTGTMLPLPAPVRLTDDVPLTFAASVMPPLSPVIARATAFAATGPLTVMVPPLNESDRLKVPLVVPAPLLPTRFTNDESVKVTLPLVPPVLAVNVLALIVPALMLPLPEVSVCVKAKMLPV